MLHMCTQAALSRVFFSDNKAEALHGDAFNRLLDNFEKTTCAKGAWLMKEGEVRNSTALS
jgi:hypothetical protein